MEQPSSLQLTITVKRGKDLVARDHSGTSDPYVVIRLNEHKFKTTVVKKNLNPVWNETFKIGATTETDVVHFKILDKDLLLHEKMGRSYINIGNYWKPGKYELDLPLSCFIKEKPVTGSLLVDMELS